MSLPTEPALVTSEWDRFAMLPEVVLFADLPPRAVVLYAVLLRYARNEGSCWPGRETLAGRLRCTVDTIDRALRVLAEADLLLVEDRPGRSNVYHLTRPGGGRKDAEGGSRKDAAGRGRKDAARKRSTRKRDIEREVDVTSPEAHEAAAACARALTSWGET